MKKFVFLIGLICLIVILNSCSKRNEPESYPQITIHYIDSSGSDLFTNGQNRYYRDSVLIYNRQNGVDSLIYLPASTYPNGYYFTYNILGGKVLTDSGTMIIGTYDLSATNNYTFNIIRLKTGVYDTLRAHLAGIIYDSIWYNGFLKKDTMTITK